MDCETCNDLLLELAYGELDEVRAAAVQKHAENCNECRQALARIRGGRAVASKLVAETAPPPSNRVLQAMEAATARAREAQALAQAVPAVTQAENNVRWLDRIGEFAMRRQVAMAAVFLMMCGVGLVFYQSNPRPTETAEGTSDVVPAVEVSSGPALQAPSTTPTAHRRVQPLPQRPAVMHEELRNRSNTAATRPLVAVPTTQPSPAPLLPEPRLTQEIPTQAAVQMPSPANAPEPPPVPAPQLAAQQPPVPQVQAPPQPQVAQQQQPSVADDEPRPLLTNAGIIAGTQRSNAGEDGEEANIQRLRAALAASTDPTSRVRIAAELAAALRSSGRGSEANVVLASENSNSMQNQGSSVPSRAYAPAARISTPMPTRSSVSTNMPARRRAAPRPAARNMVMDSHPYAAE